MPAGRPKFSPTDEQRAAVQVMAGSGSFTHEQIARVLRIDAKTLRLHFREELDLSELQMNAKVLATMFRMATSGDQPGMTAMWLKCRLGWQERIQADHRFVDAAGADRNLRVVIEYADSPPQASASA